MGWGVYGGPESCAEPRLDRADGKPGEIRTAQRGPGLIMACPPGNTLSNPSVAERPFLVGPEIEIKELP